MSRLVLWCKGSTTDFDSVGPCSNQGGTAKLLIKDK